MTRLALGCAALLILSACDDGGGGDATDGGSSGAASSTGDDPTTSGTPSTSTTDTPTTDDGTSTTTGGDEEGTSGSTTGADGSGSSSGDGGSSSTGEPIACDPPVVGEYNACFDENGNPMPVLCNYMGTGKSVGQVSCLSGPMEGSNVCMIQNCVDDCDCFDAPETGDAPSVCRDVGGVGMACILACDNGQTCPDGMTCDSGICWHGL